MKASFASFLLVFLPIASVSILAQKTSPMIISAGGGTDRNAVMQVDWTLGELAIESYSGTSRGFTEGFHQPNPSAIEIESGPDNTFVPFHPLSEAKPVLIRCYPNPVATALTIELPNDRSANLTLYVRQSNGALVMSQILEPDQKSMQVDFSSLPSGMYVVQIVDAIGHAVVAHPISKI